MSSAIETMLRWVPVAVLAAGVVGTASVAQFQIAAHADDISDNEAAIEENADDIEQIQRALIIRQGEVALKVQRIETEQQAQGEDLDAILNLLQQIRKDQ